jgi:hypothetical protein
VTPLHEVKRVADAADIESLWEDPKLGDGIVTSTFHTVVVDKPKTARLSLIDYPLHPGGDEGAYVEFRHHTNDGRAGTGRVRPATGGRPCRTAFP